MNQGVSLLSKFGYSTLNVWLVIKRTISWLIHMEGHTLADTGNDITRMPKLASVESPFNDVNGNAMSQEYIDIYHMK